MKNGLIALFFFFNITLAFAQVDYMKLGAEAKDNQEKVVYYTKAIDQNPKDPNAYFQRAFVYCYQYRFNKAIVDFNKSLTLVDNNEGKATIYGALCYAYYSLQKYEEAIQAGTESLKLNPKQVNGLRFRGLAYTQIEKYDFAISDLSEFINLNPNEAFRYIQRAAAYEMKKDYAKALSDVEKAITLEPANKNHKERKATLLTKLGRGAEAEELIKNELQCKNTDPDCLNQLGEVYLNNREYEIAMDYFNKAEKLYDEMVKKDPKYAQNNLDALYNIYFNMGTALTNKGVYPDALKRYNRAADLKPNEYLIWNRIAELQCVYLKNYLEATMAYEKSFRLNPTYTDGWVNYGYSFGELQKRKEAIEVYNRALKVPSVQSKGLLLNNLGFSYLEIKDYDNSLKILQQAIAEEPSRAMSHISLAEYYIEKNEYDKSISIFNEVFEMDNMDDKETQVAYYKRGLAYLKKYELDKNNANLDFSISNFTESLKINPEYVEVLENLGIAYFYKNDLCNSYKNLQKSREIDLKGKFKKTVQATSYLNKVLAKKEKPCQ